MKGAAKIMGVLVTVCAAATLLAALAAPLNFTAIVSGDDVVFDWDPVVDATKYSVDIEAEVTVAALGEETVELSFGTSDRTDGGDMSDSDLTVPIATILSEIAAELGVDEADIISFDATAKVKALNPGRGKGRQNNPFSNTADFSWSSI
jgi:hypothetical protein